MLRDLMNNLKFALCIAPVVVTADVDGVGIEVRNFDSCMLIACGGAIVAAGLVAPKAYESDDSVDGTAGSGTWTAVDAADLDGGLFTNMTAGSVQKRGYRGNKKWVRVAADYVSGTSLALFTGVIAGDAHQRPVA